MTAKDTLCLFWLNHFFFGEPLIGQELTGIKQKCRFNLLIYGSVYSIPDAQCMVYLHLFPKVSNLIQFVGKNNQSHSVSGKKIQQWLVGGRSFIQSSGEDWRKPGVSKGCFKKNTHPFAHQAASGFQPKKHIGCHTFRSNQLQLQFLIKLFCVSENWSSTYHK